MSMTELFLSGCKQKAVYWGNPTEDGYGGLTFDDPVEIYCRWEDKTQILGAITGNQVLGYSETSRAIVYLLQDVTEEGYLWLGELTDLDSYLDSSDGTYIDPRTVPNAHIIKRFEKTPSFGSTTVFLRRAFLTPWLS